MELSAQTQAIYDFDRGDRMTRGQMRVDFGDGGQEKIPYKDNEMKGNDCNLNILINIDCYIEDPNF